MLIGFVFLYLFLSVAVGLLAATRVHSTRDYVMAGRSLPLFVVMATVFATWFGSETVLGIPATFMEEGLGGVVEDPFGAAACLVLVGLFFAAKLYRKNLLTIGDYYRLRYNHTIELLSSFAIVLSYLGWVAAQLTALVLVFNVVTQGEISVAYGIVLGAGIVLVYTLFGGMFSVAWTNAVQMVVIVLGLLYIGWILAGKAGGVMPVIEHAQAAGKFEFWPQPTTAELLAFIGAAVTLMFGSIPQQDVFQRVNSAKTERIAVVGTVLGGSFYLLFAFVPIFLAYAALLIEPAMVEAHLGDDAQKILPDIIMGHTPVLAQIIFFGALLSAIMSTAASTLLAPSVTITENILKGYFKKELTDKQFLLTIRTVVVLFAIFVTLFALQSDSSIYEMVGNAYTVTLVSAFVPLVAGLYWSRATTQGAICSMVSGVGVWLVLGFLLPALGIVVFGDIWPPQLAGLLAAIVGMIAGSLLPQVYAKGSGHPEAEAV
ncbi:MAG: sodium:solute symporter family protein [Moraxellaceae bacterium]|nr:sodium:solute symporter family protein [Moraxellaceae bacterium]